MARRLRVLSAYPGLGRPNDIVSEDLVLESGQAYVDAGLAEWADHPATRAVVYETTVDAPVEATVRRRRKAADGPR
jgi:hypothetical protein